MPVSLTPPERIQLKARAHALEPIVKVGHAGVSDAVIAEIDRALTAHELIKVRAPGMDRDERDAAFVAICQRTGAQAVQQVGKVFVLFRKRDEQA